MKVLICDDAGFIRQIVIEVLSQSECILFEASDGKQALDMATSLSPDIVFLDIVLPQKNGVEVAKILKAQDPKIKLVAMTTLELPQIENNYDIGNLFDHMLHKPFTKQSINEIMRGIRGTN